MFDKARLIGALERLGEDLLARGLFMELAIYGGRAIVLQFDWRRSTEDVDAVVREGYDEQAPERRAKKWIPVFRQPGALSESHRASGNPNHGAQHYSKERSLRLGRKADFFDASSFSGSVPTTFTHFLDGG